LKGLIKDMEGIVFLNLHNFVGKTKETRDLLGEENVVYLEPEDEEWKLYWELYVRSSVFLQHPQLVKLFESENNSINISIQPSK